MSTIQVEDAFKVGENDHGYYFGVGRVGGRWVGFAVGDAGESGQMMFLLPGISEDYHLGLLDRDRAIRMTGAIAQSPEHGYGGISRWFVEESLRGKPEDFRCEDCQEVGCSGDCSYDAPDYY